MPLLFSFAISGLILVLKSASRTNKLFLPCNCESPSQNLCAIDELDVQVPTRLRRVCVIGARLRMFGAKRVRYFVVSVHGRFAPGSALGKYCFLFRYSDPPLFELRSSLFQLFLLLNFEFRFANAGIHHECRRRTRPGLVRRSHCVFTTMCDSRQWSHSDDKAVRAFSSVHAYMRSDLFRLACSSHCNLSPLFIFQLRFVESECQGFSVRKPTLVTSTCAQVLSSFPSVAMSAGLEFAVSCPAGMCCFSSPVNSYIPDEDLLCRRVIHHA